MGVPMTLTPQAISRCIADTGIGFMFAPNHHPAMKNVAPVRKELGVRTIFNILGPLTNPADAPNILMGVFHPDLVGIQVRALQRLGAEHAVVVYGRDGMDEVSLGAATMVGEYKDGGIREYEIHPEDFGLTMASNRALKVDSAEGSKALLRSVLDDEPGPARDIVLLNAGVALYAANVAPIDGRGRGAGARGRGLGQGAGQDAPVRRRAPRSWRAEHERHPATHRRGQARGGRRGEAAARRGVDAPRGAGAAAGARLRRRAAREDRRRAGRGDRRDQEGQPEQGRAARALRAGRDCRVLCAARRGLPERAHRPAVLPGRRRLSCSRRARPATCRCCARTSWSTPTRWTRRGPGARTASC